MSKHKITKQEYFYECGDKCCSEQGTDWTLDGVPIYNGPDDDQALLFILAALGVEAEIVGLDESGEEIWSL